MSGPGLRIGIVGATGALGGEVLAALDASDLRIGEILAFATDRSLGEDLEFQDQIYPVRTEPEGGDLPGIDLLFCCAPAAASIEWVRRALRAQVPCVDCSGSLADQPDVPLRAAAFAPPPGAEGAPLVATPSGAALAWSLALAPLHRAAGVERVVGTVLETAGAAGRDGIAALSLESLALFNQQELPEDAQTTRPLAFDCHGSVGELADGGRTTAEDALEQGVRRLLGAEFPVTATVSQVPAFVGQASSLAVELARPLDPKEAEDHLAQADGVELWVEDALGPNLRASAGRDVVIAGRVRRDASRPHALQLWLVADVLRLAASNAVALAQARLQVH
ncbi:MAG: Asd/ArgC dimerization domain-containing protein [Myxococcota bacterium]